MDDFWGLDSRFLRSFRFTMNLGTVMLPFGIGGMFGGAHYVFVRKRRSLVEIIEENPVDQIR